MAGTTITSHEARCLRPGCGRVLRSAKSVAAGYGPVCLRKIRAAAIAEAKAGFTPDQQARADELIRDGGLVPTTRPRVFRAVSSKGDATYLVQATNCTCAGGLRARRPCYHQLAARILAVASNPPAPVRVAVPMPRPAPPVAGIWAQLDKLGATNPIPVF